MPRTAMDIIREIRGEPGTARPLVRIIVTSTGEVPEPWFMVVDTNPVSELFIAETIARLFGYQPDGSLHTWEKGNDTTCHTIRTEEH